MTLAKLLALLGVAGSLLDCAPARSSSTLLKAGATPPSVHFFRIEAEQQTEVARRRLGDVTGIEIEGLKSGTIYRLNASLRGLTGESLQSWMTARADAFGRIDTSTAQPLDGSYAFADVDGIFWSMAIGPAPAPPPGLWRFEVLQGAATLARADLPMEILTPGVTVADLGADGLVAKVFTPPAAAKGAPRPAVIVLSGSEGGIASTLTTASALATQGYVAVSLGWFGLPGLPAELAEIPLEYFQRALTWLASRPDVDRNRIAVIGTSRGGELALLLGATFPAIHAVVGLVPSPVLWGANSDAPGAPRSAWTLGGRPLAFLETVGGLDDVTLPDGSHAQANRPAFSRGLAAASSADIEAATAHVERINGPVLMIGGSDDLMWASCDLVAMGMERLRRLHHAFADQSYCAQGAGHGAGGLPGFPTTTLAMEHPQMHVRVAFGGTPAANAAAERRSWTLTLDFLRKTFKE